MRATNHHPMFIALRVLHLAIGASMTAATALLAWAALSGAFGPWSALALSALGVQWIVVALADGHCPLGAAHARYGDQKTMFELVAGPQYARHGFRRWGWLCASSAALLTVRLLLGA